MKTPQDYGREWEVEFAQIIGGTPQPGSGNLWHSKMDVRGSSILWSCKWTANTGFLITSKVWQEVVDAVDGPGGTGTMPGLAIRTATSDLVVLRVEDLLTLLSQPPTIAAQKADNRRATARVPQLLREACQREDPI